MAQGRMTATMTWESPLPAVAGRILIFTAAKPMASIRNIFTICWKKSTFISDMTAPLKTPRHIRRSAVVLITGF